MINYYETIMGQSKDNFISVFNEEWNQELCIHKTKYKAAHQLSNGNRIRPILLAWGYYSQHNSSNNHDVAACAISIELIHKASILLDDYIDKDTARHGLPSFHIEYTDEEAVLYAIFLLNRSIKRIRELDMPGLDLLIDTISDMALGGLMEISQENIIISDIKEIIDYETTKLIQNSFVLGYMLSQPFSLQVPKNIYDIGKYAGYCFQTLNDLEPFMDIEKNIKYKGGKNYDINNSRKNIVIAYLYGACSNTEREFINKKTLNDEQLHQLVSNYKIIDSVFDEVTYYFELIKKSVSEMSHYSCQNYLTDFRSFLKYMFEICYSRLGTNLTYAGFNDW